MIFPEVKRSYTGPILASEPEYAYLQRSARPEAQLIRDILESWVLHIPNPHRRELVARLQSHDDRHFFSASFEIYLHELLTKMECHLKLHPSMPAETGARPDFLATPPTDSAFYLEARVASEESDADAAASARRSTVYDAVNRISNPAFFIAVHERGDPTAPPSVGRIRRETEEWLASLNPDQLFDRYQSGDLSALPSLTRVYFGWRVTFTAIPRAPDRRATVPERAIGTHSRGLYASRAREIILSRLTKKSGRYGRPGKPYVIALNVLARHADHIDVMEALFGQESPIPSSSQDGEYDMERLPNGFWHGPKGVQNTRVSAVLLTSRLDPWRFAEVNLCLYHNPWAEHVLEGALCRLTQRRLVSDSMNKFPGTEAREILGLPPRWPNAEAQTDHGLSS